MHLFDEIRKVVATVADRIAASRRGSEFTCGECERNERCGLPPHDDCVVKAAQLARDGEYGQRQPASLYKGVWPR
jgi:hypothetical protein